MNSIVYVKPYFKIELQFANTLEDNIEKRGAMDKLISDSTRPRTSNRVEGTLRELFIDDF